MTRSSRATSHPAEHLDLWTSASWLVLLRSIFEATEVTIPTSFIIVPVRFEPKREQPEGTVPLLQLAEDGSGVELSSAGAEIKAQVEKGIGWFDQVRSLGANKVDRPGGYPHQVQAR